MNSLRAWWEADWPVFPVSGKKPLVRWKPYQTRLPTEAEIDEWEERWPDAGVALATGRLAGVVIGDLDLHKLPDEAAREAKRAEVDRILGPSPWVSTTVNGGDHRWYQWPGYEVPNSAGDVCEHVDIRGDGGFVVVPPSPGYDWERIQDEKEELPVYSVRVADLEAACAGMEHVDLEAMLKVSVPEGSRNETAAAVAGKLLARGVPVEEGLAALREWNARNAPPLPDAEVVSVWTSILTRERKKRKAEGVGESLGSVAAPLPTFQRTKDGSIKATLNNVIAAIEDGRMVGRWGVVWDAFLGALGVVEPDGTWRRMENDDYVRLRRRLEASGMGAVGRDLMKDAAGRVGRRHQVDCAVAWLSGLTWDGTGRVERCMAEGFGAEEGPYSEAVGRYLWTALAGRVAEPGCQVDMVPILVGEQGVGKSTGVALLAPWPDAFAEINLLSSEADLYRQLRGVTVAEMGELRGMRMRDRESIKSFVTRRVDEWVPKYEELAVRAPRRCVFVGTTNSQEFLTDETGNRRWLPIRVGAVDRDWLRTNRDQLWAEGYARWLVDGVDWQDAERLGRDMVGEFEVVDSWDEAVDQALRGRSQGISVRAILQSMDGLGMELSKITRRDEMRISAILRRKGWVKAQVQREKNRKWLWFPPVPF